MELMTSASLAPCEHPHALVQRIVEEHEEQVPRRRWSRPRTRPRRWETIRAPGKANESRETGRMDDAPTISADPLTSAPASLTFERVSLSWEFSARSRTTSAWQPRQDADAEWSANATAAMPAAAAIVVSQKALDAMLDTRCMLIA